MNPVKIEEDCQPQEPVSYFHTPVHQHFSCSQSIGFFQGRPTRFFHVGAQTVPSMATTRTQTPQPPPGAFQYYRAMMNSMPCYCMPQLPGSTGDSTACQLHTPTPKAHTSMKPVEDAVQKRELRLMKNREAARASRKRKKEYMDFLQTHNALLESENQILKTQLQSLNNLSIQTPGPDQSATPVPSLP